MRSAIIIIKKLIDLKDDGSFRLNMKYFNYATGLTMTNKNFSDLFEQKVREPEKELLTQFHMDIAASIQSATEEIVLKLTKSVANETKIKNLCMAGGVALNCVANGKILKKNIFDNIWLQPAAGDAGGSLGSALAFWYQELGNERNPVKNGDEMRGSYLGPYFKNDQIENSLKKLKAVYKKCDEEDLINTVAKEINNKISFANNLSEIFPELNKKDLLKKLNSGKKFIWIKKLLSPESERKLFNLGQPG